MGRIARRPQVSQPLDETYRVIPLTRNLLTLVSAHRFEVLSKYHWYAWQARKGEPFYACRTENGTKKRIYLHREILGLEDGDGKFGDHRNPADTLDNRDENLRVADGSQSAANRRVNKMGFRGVIWDKARGKWRVSIKNNRRTIHIARVDNPIDGARLYDAKARELFGDFAILNFHK